MQYFIRNIIFVLLLWWEGSILLSWMYLHLSLIYVILEKLYNLSELQLFCWQNGAQKCKAWHREGELCWLSLAISSSTVPVVTSFKPYAVFTQYLFIKVGRVFLIIISHIYLAFSITSVKNTCAILTFVKENESGENSFLSLH